MSEDGASMSTRRLIILCVTALVTVGSLNAVVVYAITSGGGGNMSFAFFQDTEFRDVDSFGRGNVTADIPIAYSCVLWANSTTDKDALKLGGGGHRFEGCVHSNNGIWLGGSNSLFNASIRYVTSIKNNFNGHILAEEPVQVPAEPWPIWRNIEDYAPGGPAAVAAEEKFEYTYLPAGGVVNDLTPDGLIFAEGDVTVEGPLDATMTVVTRGKLSIKGSHVVLREYVDNLVFLTYYVGSNAIHSNVDDSVMTGGTHAYFGHITISGQRSTFEGQFVGDTIQVQSQESTFLPRSPILR